MFYFFVSLCVVRLAVVLLRGSLTMTFLFLSVYIRPIRFFRVLFMRIVALDCNTILQFLGSVR
jgi:hypothetical protein